MGANVEFLKSLPVESPHLILRRLAEHAEKYASWDKNPLEVTVLLSSGHSISGQVGRMLGEVALLWQGDLHDPAVVYVPIAQVVGILVKRATMVTSLGSAETIRERSGTPPTRMELRRTFAKTATSLQADGISLDIDGDWTSLLGTADELFTLVAMAPQLDQALRQVGRDSQGWEALNKISSISIASEADTRVRCEKNGAILRIIGDWRRPQVGSIVNTLVEGIEAVL